MTENKYGYKVCYKQHGKRKLKIYLVTNSYDLAFWEIRWYETHSPPDRKTRKPITNVVWVVIPIKTYICPLYPRTFPLPQQMERKTNRNFALYNTRPLQEVYLWA